MGRAVQVEWLLQGVLDASGNVLGAGKVYFFEPGTTTPRNVYTDIGKTTPAAHPVVLDSAGQALVYADGAYKIRVDDSDSNTIYTRDNLRFFFPSGNILYGGLAGGSSNAFTITVTPTPTEYNAGDIYFFKANHTVTGASTLNVNSLGVKNLQKSNLSTSSYDALDVADINVGDIVGVIYDGTQFIMLSTLNNFWTNYSPTYGTITTVTTTVANYFIKGKEAHVQLKFNGTMNGETSLTASVPIASATGNIMLPCLIQDVGASAATPGIALISSSTITIQKAAAAAFGSGAGVHVWLNGSYHIT